jgi:hypothetical protein
MILISTLPDKGEESLDLQSPLTTSPNLDNCISTPLPEQLVDSDDRHGFLTGRCGRHRYSGATRFVCSWQAARHSRYTSMLMPPAARCTGALPVRVGLYALAAPSQGRSSLFTLLSFTCSSTLLAVPLMPSLLCRSRLSLAWSWLSLPTATATSTLALAAVLSLTCCSTLT